MNYRIYYSREAEQLAQQRRTLVVLLAMALGSAIGGTIALLFAPKKGEDIRKNLVDHAGQAYDSSREATAKTLERLQKDFDALRRDVEERLTRVQ
jgi:gas vesicle protein